MPRSAARVMTLGSEVIMQPKPRVVRLRPVRPSGLFSSLTGSLTGLSAFSEDCSKPVFEAAAATGSINPAERNSRRDDFSVMEGTFPGEGVQHIPALRDGNRVWITVESEMGNGD